MLASMGEPARPLLRPGALDSALHRPQLAAHYEDADLATQAALLVGGIAQAHAFEDGNKRTALMCGDVFLHNNGWWVSAEPLSFARQIESLVDRAVSTDEATTALADWLRERLRPIDATGTLLPDGHYYDLPIDVSEPGMRAYFEGSRK
jgi:death-on-curing protein